MHIELTVLAFAGLLHALVFVLFAIAANRQVGPKKTLGPRDTPIDLTGVSARLQRTLTNSNESLILFTPALIILISVDKTSQTTAYLAHAFLFARILYIPAYIFGWVPWRSVIWGIGWAASLALYVIALL